MHELTARWSLAVGAPYDSPDVTASWVAPVELPDGSPAVLKIALPHMEADHEADGLRCWNGDPTVYLLRSDTVFNALLLERCTPGTSLRTEPGPQQDFVVASLLRRLWKVADPGDLSSALDHVVFLVRGDAHSGGTVARLRPRS